MSVQFVWKFKATGGREEEEGGHNMMQKTLEKYTTVSFPTVDCYIIRRDM